MFGESLGDFSSCLCLLLPQQTTNYQPLMILGYCVVFLRVWLQQFQGWLLVVVLELSLILIMK